MLTTCLDGWVGGRVALEEWKLRLTSAKVEVEAELGNIYQTSIMFLAGGFKQKTKVGRFFETPCYIV